MKSLVVLGVALCAGCGGSAPPPPDHADHANFEEPVARGTTPPTLAAGADGKLVATGLPAIARASELIVVLVPDGAAWRIDSRDRDDKTLRSFSVTAATLADANKQLATLHGVHDLHAMTVLAVEAGHDHEDQHWATGDNLDVEWRDHHISVFRHNANAALVEKDGALWLAPDRGACTNPAFLRAAYHGPNTSSLVIDIGYRDGGADCAAPVDQLHVITWYEH